MTSTLVFELASGSTGGCNAKIFPENMPAALNIIGGGVRKSPGSDPFLMGGMFFFFESLMGRGFFGAFLIVLHPGSWLGSISRIL